MNGETQPPDPLNSNPVEYSGAIRNEPPGHLTPAERVIWERAQLYARMALNARSLGTSQAELLAFTESLNQAVILSGASAR